MILMHADFEIDRSTNGGQILKNIEASGRTCYKSEKNITDISALEFTKKIISNGHESVLEHQSIMVKITCDRGVSHELVRHRIAAYSQESTRYCNYKSGVTFIIPPWVNIEPGEYAPDSKRNPVNLLSLSDAMWFYTCAELEKVYISLLNQGWSPQKARTILPNSLKTEIVITQNLRQWRHWFRLRALGESGKPHPQMLEIAIPMLEKFKEVVPVVFDDLKPKV